MSKVRVMLVDDSVVNRRLVGDVLATDPEIDVVARAGNGAVALEQLAAAKPDVVVLDVEMPVMDGLETLVNIRKLFPKLPVIMFSTLTTKGGNTTLEALARGATDYVAKPANVGSVAESQQKVRDDLIPKIRFFGGRTRPAPPPLPVTVGAARSRPPTPGGRIDCVVIGVSTGGPKALQEVVPQLPADLPVPVAIVQHMPPVFTGLLAERLDKTSPLRVLEAQEGTPFTAGSVLVAPGDHHLLLVRRGFDVVAHLTQDPPENSCRPAVDPLFRSAAALYGPHTLAVVLTGMGSDGCIGAAVVRDGGGQVVAQDEATSVVWGMPGAVARAGLAEVQLPLDRVANEIVQRVRRGRAAAPGAPAAPARSGG